MNVKSIVSTWVIMCVTVTVAMAQRTEIKAGEVLRDGEALFSKSGNVKFFNSKDGGWMSVDNKSSTFKILQHWPWGTPVWTLFKPNDFHVPATISFDETGGLYMIFDEKDFGKKTRFIIGSSRINDKVIKIDKVMLEEDGSLGIYDPAGKKITSFKGRKVNILHHR